MKNYKTLTTLAAAGLLVTTVTTSAATLAQYFDGDYSTDSLSGSQLAVNPDVTASDMSRVVFSGDPGGGAGTMRNSFGAANPFTDSDPTTSNYFFVYNGANAPATIDDTAYMQFTVTAGSGLTLDLSNITLDWAWASDNTNPGWTSSLDVQASTDGSIFSTVTGSTRTESTGAITAGDMSYFTGGDNLVIDMSSLANAASYTIRIRSADSTTSNSHATSLFQNVTLNGNVVAVPESSSALLIGLGGLALLRRRRRV